MYIYIIRVHVIYHPHRHISYIYIRDFPEDKEIDREREGKRKRERERKTIENFTKQLKHILGKKLLILFQLASRTRSITHERIDSSIPLEMQEPCVRILRFGQGGA